MDSRLPLLLFLALSIVHSLRAQELAASSEFALGNLTELSSEEAERPTDDSPPAPFAPLNRHNVEFSTEEDSRQVEDLHNWKCMGCRGAVEILKFLFERNATADRILDVANYICRKFADQNVVICKGITAQFRESFLYVLEQMVFRPKQLCGLLMKDCGVPDNPFDGNWTIPLPPKPDINARGSNSEPPLPFGPQRNPNNEERPIFKVIQLSDLHFDFDYQNGSEAACDRPLCCQGEARGHVKKPAGYWGTLAACDVPLRTIESLFASIAREHMKEDEKKVDYILLTGDYMSHTDWRYTRQSHLDVIGNLSMLINTYFPDVPTFWGIGNHEGVPVNSFAPHTVPRKFWPEWIYRAIYEVGHKWIPPEQFVSTIYRGSFSCMITEKFKLISVNTGYCETTNFFLYLNQSDPDGTLKWLVDELYDAEQRGIVVHIMAHIPPGDSECLEGWARNYYRIVTRFEFTIRAQFFGHVHTDSFTVFYENMNDFRSRPVSVLFSAPSVTTFDNLNPAYRVYYIDGNYERSTYEVLDFDTYFLNLSRPQGYPDPQWEFLYSAKQEYGLPDLTAASWNELGEKLRYNTTLYNRFLKNYARRDDYACDDKCRAELLCSLRRGHHNESALCPEASVLRRVFPALTTSPIVDPAVLEPLTRDEFVIEAKRTVWNRVSNWLFGAEQRF
ncbi:Sphingomyelin phosphodiesterase [Aphelenchoides fujianensis]|nr:Sphingomyelin phosphodiesterase [Aphelenchoides fujianensis]